MTVEREGKGTELSPQNEAIKKENLES